MGRQWIKRVPIDLDDGETIISHSVQFLDSVNGKREHVQGFFVITDRRVLFARPHYWTDSLMQSLKKVRRWIRLDVPRTAIVGATMAEEKVLFVKAKVWTLQLGDGTSANVLAENPAELVAQLASLGLAVPAA